MNINSANSFNKSISRPPAGHFVEFIINSREILDFFVENRVQTSIKRLYGYKIFYPSFNCKYASLT